MFRVLPEPFDVSNGLLTPSMKLRRDEIVRRYALEIDAMYQSRTRPARPRRRTTRRCGTRTTCSADHARDGVRGLSPRTVGQAGA